MLAMAEGFLLACLAQDPALQSAPRPALVTGGAPPPRERSSAVLALWLRSMRALPPEPEAPEANRRDTARLVRHLTLYPDAMGCAFPIPSDRFCDKVDLLAEVSANGHQLRAGDDYLLDGLTICCRCPPGVPLDARILSKPASGYIERGAAEVQLVLRAWGPSSGTPDQQAAAADAALTRGIAALKRG
jgi:hypothetical protein